MFQLDDNLLQELGLGSLPPAEKNKMLAHIYETLELRVGMHLAEQMTDEQLDEFEGFIDKNDEAGALHWLETNFPEYKKVVAQQLEKLKSEIKAQAPQIVQATMQAVENPQPQSDQSAAPQQPDQPTTQQASQPSYAPAPQQPSADNTYPPEPYQPTPEQPEPQPQQQSQPPFSPNNPL